MCSSDLGWSPSRRNNPYANSGIVVSVDENDYRQDSSTPLDALLYQQSVEQLSFKAGGGSLRAPAQRLIDFVEGKNSATLPPNSYIPGLTPYQLDQILPQAITSSLRESLRVFGKKMKPLYTNEAILVATESRTSSPVRIPRDKIGRAHV